MGIEKYFQPKGASSSSKTNAAKPKETKAAEPAKKVTARKRKTTDDQDNDDNGDFQKPVQTKSSFFAPAENKIDPKAFFGSSKSSASKSSDAPKVKEETKPAAKKRTAPVADEEEEEEVVAWRPKSATKKRTAATSEETKPAARKRTTAASEETKPAAKKHTTVAVEETKPATKKRAAAAVEETELAPVEETKPTPRRARAKTIVISDSEDDYEGNEEAEEEDDYVEVNDAPAVKKAKREKSFEEPKKTESKKTAKTSAAAKKAAVKKEEEEEEQPKKKSNYFARMATQEGPSALGTRPEPVGASNCLNGLTFVCTGQYDTLTRDQIKSIVMRYGGRVTGSVSGKTDYLAMGKDAGDSKAAKAKSLGTKVLDEDAFYKLVESSAPQEVVYAPPPKPKGKGKESDSVLNTTISKSDNATQLWTEKYKPQKLEEIIGNKELVRKISEWLANWQDNFKKGFAGEGDNLLDYKALLLSGPPGIGKTTTASVVAKLNGYEPLEFNASDVRSKKVLEASITEMMDNRTMTEFFQPAAKDKKVEAKLLQGKKVVLIMDEVDGMSGGDRGGSVQLAGLIRASKIPVICICNDSRSDKVAPLQRVCYEAKYKRTPAAQIRSRILSIAFKEKLKIAPNAVDELVAATHNDIRQIINILSTYRLNESTMDYDKAKAVGKNNEKHSILGLFDIPLELLSNTSWVGKTLSQKADVYFHDYALAHLIISENYLRCRPIQANAPDGNPKVTACNEMDLIAKAADAMADGDLVDGMIHGTVQHYSLMPVHSIFSCVRPASYMRGSIQQRIMFPSWLGQNSKAGKYARQLSDVQTRMRLKASGDKFEIRQNYIPTLNERIFGLLKEENYDEAMEYMDNYYLDRENIDVLSELTFSGSKKGPFGDLSTKVKTTFTRQYNAKNHPILFQLSGEPIKKAVSAGPTEDAEGTLVEEDGATFGEDVSEEEQDMEDDPEKDLQSIKYIKESTSKKRKTAAASNSKSGGVKKQRTKK